MAEVCLLEAEDEKDGTVLPDSVRLLGSAKGHEAGHGPSDCLERYYACLSGA